MDRKSMSLAAIEHHAEMTTEKLPLCLHFRFHYVGDV
jgi:hypothetical protein